MLTTPTVKPTQIQWNNKTICGGEHVAKSEAKNALNPSHEDDRIVFVRPSSDEVTKISETTTTNKPVSISNKNIIQTFNANGEYNFRYARGVNEMK